MEKLQFKTIEFDATEETPTCKELSRISGITVKSKTLGDKVIYYYLDASDAPERLRKAFLSCRQEITPKLILRRLKRLNDKFTFTDSQKAIWATASNTQKLSLIGKFIGIE